MTPENFCYWLSGFMEIADPVELSPEEVKKIKDNLKLVFDKLGNPYVTLPNQIPGNYGPIPQQIYVGDPLPGYGSSAGHITWQQPPVTYTGVYHSGGSHPVTKG